MSHIQPSNILFCNLIIEDHFNKAFTEYSLHITKVSCVKKCCFKSLMMQQNRNCRGAFNIQNSFKSCNYVFLVIAATILKIHVANGDDA